MSKIVIDTIISDRANIAIAIKYEDARGFSVI